MFSTYRVAFLCFLRDRDLSRFLDGELPLREYRRVQEHVRGCPRCARRLDEFRSIDRWVAALPEGAWPRPASTRVVVAAALTAALAASLAANLLLPASRPDASSLMRATEGPSEALDRLYARLSEGDVAR